MLHTAEIDMTDSVSPGDVDVFLDIGAWAICSTYHTVLKASPGAAMFGWDMLFDIPFIANWNKIGDYRQHQTDLRLSFFSSETDTQIHKRTGGNSFLRWHLLRICELLWIFVAPQTAGAWIRAFEPCPPHIYSRLPLLPMTLSCCQ